MTTSDSQWYGFWAAAYLTFAAVAYYLDRHAALRGTKGKPPNVVLDKGLRLFFWCLLALPWWRFKVVMVLWCLYLPTFLDGYVSAVLSCLSSSRCSHPTHRQHQRRRPLLYARCA
jgi:hypothetical protein